MTPPHIPSPETGAPAEGAVGDPAQRALVDLVAAIAALLPPGMLQALAAAAANVVAETQQLAARATEAATVCERERANEMDALRATARDAEAARASERVARLAAEDAARILRSRNETLRRAVADIGARTAIILSADANVDDHEHPADDSCRAAEASENPAADRPDPGEGPKSAFRRTANCGAAALGGRSGATGDRAPRPEPSAPQ